MEVSHFMTRHPSFDPASVHLGQLSDRGHDLVASACLPLDVALCSRCDGQFLSVVESIYNARQFQRPVVVLLGGHPIKLGLSRFIVDLIERGWITHIATNGAGIIHDFELALVGGTSEDVAKWIRVGQFGLWHETSLLNDAIRESAKCGEGLGEGVGRFIEEHEFRHRDLSIAAAGWRCGVPVTSHVTIGGDIIHAMPNCDGAALGQTSYTDFLIFARAIQDLDGGVFLNIGSAVTGPEVYLKALSMARNVARQQGKEIRHFTTAVFDLVQLPENWRDGPPSKDHPGYYFRPWKTILIRTVADGGQSYYFCMDHRESIPALWNALVNGNEL
jgi:hypothetical protein